MDAAACIAAHVLALPPVRTPLHAARGRLLREDLHAPHDLPAFDRSAMDGYAICQEDASPRFRVIGEVQPGAGVELEIGPGECARIFTGAPLPRGASQVLMQEDVVREGEWMIPQVRTATTHVRRRGEDIQAGSVVLPAGTRLAPPELSLLAHLGLTTPLVSPAPRVRHIATGRELVAPEATPGPGEIRDSNSTLLAALLENAGLGRPHQSRCGDSLEELLAAIASAPEAPWDLLLISGGASVGDYDFGARALREAGFTLHFEKVNLRPGKPLVFATRGAQAAFVLPGNPVSHFILFHVALQVALAALEGGSVPHTRTVVSLARSIDEPSGPRETYWPARVLPAEGWRAQPLRWQSSGDLSGLRGANAILIIPAHSGPLAAGAEVSAILTGW